MNQAQQDNMNIAMQPGQQRSFADLVAISDTITLRGLAPRTSKSYSGHVQAYHYWHQAKAVPTPIFPLDATAVRAWLTDLRLEKPDLQWKSYCQRIASLRAWSRDIDRNLPCHQLDYDWVNNRTVFTDFMKSLKNNIPNKPPKQAEAIDQGLCSDVVSHILNTEQNLFLKERDVCLITGGFLKGLRASDMAVLDYLKSVQWSPTADAETVFYWTVFGGKTTKEKAETYSFSNVGMSFDIVGVFANYHWIIMDMYAKNILQPIDTWKDKVMLPGEELLDPENRFFSPLFVTYDTKKQRPNSCPLNNQILTKIMRHRINNFLKDTKPDMSTEERAAFCKKFSSHSLKRGAVTESVKLGCSDQELRTKFRFRRTHTVNKYIQAVSIEENTKMPKL